MRVSPISFKNASSTQRKSVDREYWHVCEKPALNPDLQRLEAKKNRNSIILGLCTVGFISALAIIKFQKRGATLASKDVVEFFSQTRGLDKIRKYEGNIIEIKEKILYPYKAVMMGDQEPLHCNMQKMGLVLGGENKQEVREILEATAEHARELGINVVTCPFEKFKTDAAKRFSKSANKEEEMRRYLGQKVKNWFFKEIEQGEIRFNKSVPSGKYDYTFINLGNIDTLASKEYLGDNLKALEALLKKANNQDVKGVCWLSHAEDSKTLEFFFNDSSVLVTKLVE